MKLTFIDKDFQKHSSFEIAPEDEKRWENPEFKKKDVSKIIIEAVNALKKTGIMEEDIRIIDWEKMRLYHLKDFSVDKII
jgi:hypothetical protein